jgi:hypothetical protein
MENSKNKQFVSFKLKKKNVAKDIFHTWVAQYSGFSEAAEDK